MVSSVHALHDYTGIQMGPTSGAAYLVAQWWAKKNPGKTVVALLPDSGVRYLNQVYNQNWIEKWKLNEPSLRASSLDPCVADSLADVRDQWCYIKWQRHSLSKWLT
jgi:S-sulfo-L-cysteine synthase (3-phospho-L-serine-dependent)